MRVEPYIWTDGRTCLQVTNLSPLYPIQLDSFGYIDLSGVGHEFPYSSVTTNRPLAAQSREILHFHEGSKPIDPKPETVRYYFVKDTARKTYRSKGWWNTFVLGDVAVRLLLIGSVGAAGIASAFVGAALDSWPLEYVGAFLAGFTLAATLFKK